MIIIADSGSTKTDWIVLEGVKVVRRYNSKGINPVYISIEQIEEVLNSTFNLDLKFNDISKVFFYGAGCMDYENSERIEIALKNVFRNAEINVASDILAAAISLFNNKPGIGIILGTGANICVFDGNKITSTRSGVGYILGDEGSGAHIGKLLIQDYLNDFIPNVEKELLELNYDLDRSKIINSIYIKQDANLFLAQFSKFIYQNIDKQYFKSLVKDSFRILFSMHLTQISDSKNNKLGFVGSVAFYFQDVLKEVAAEYNMEIHNIIQKPIDGLIEYHSSI
jgi:N-acetylglucosamine kinase-like BadF-type ATPase